jgi:hypothetical protein
MIVECEKVYLILWILVVIVEVEWVVEEEDEEEVEEVVCRILECVMDWSL